MQYKITPPRGFHRNLLIKLDLEEEEEEWQDSTNFVLLLQATTDYFFDPFELKRLDFGNFEYHHSVASGKDVDLEAAASSPASKPHVVAFSTVASSSTASSTSSLNPFLSVPFHLRYQAPTFNSSQTHVAVSLVHPFVVYPCSQSLSHKASYSSQSGGLDSLLRRVVWSSALPDSTLSHLSSVIAKSDKRESGTGYYCGAVLKYTTNDSPPSSNSILDPPLMLVPVADTAWSPIVTPLTYLIAISGVFYILILLFLQSRAVCEKKRN